MYEEQTGSVKLADKRSSTFRITNGTRQGSVLSPALFSIYLDDLIQKLRQLGLGCHIGGWVPVVMLMIVSSLALLDLFSRIW